MNWALVRRKWPSLNLCNYHAVDSAMKILYYIRLCIDETTTWVLSKVNWELVRLQLNCSFKIAFERIQLGKSHFIVLIFAEDRGDIPWVWGRSGVATNVLSSCGPLIMGGPSSRVSVRGLKSHRKNNTLKCWPGPGILTLLIKFIRKWMSMNNVCPYTSCWNEQGTKNYTVPCCLGRKNFQSPWKKSTDWKSWERKAEDITWLRVKVTKFWVLAI